MRGQLYRVLEDTRNETNPNICRVCGSPVSVMIAQSTERYHVCVYECSQCKALSFYLSEVYQD